MSDQRGVVAALAEQAGRGEPVVLASVVRVVGAAYRGIGARMLVRADGSTVGMVSAGCLEADLIAHADRVRAAGEPVVITYDTRADDEVVWGLGLGCDGIVEVLLEPLAPARATALAAFLGDVLAREQVTVLATVIRAEGEGAPRPGARVLVGVPDSATARDGDWGDGTALAHVLADPPSSTPDVGYLNTHSTYAAASAAVAYEVVAPPVRLVICGSGPD
ncbi:MAG: XdhC family protein, partial [Candidatus Eremiobacteraeota bacterium]|nr:XdhC family protein [Candidatus Eremiobacteraeota bacterium]